MTFNYKQLLEQVTEFKSSPLDILAQAEEVRLASLDAGVLSEKVHNKDGGVVDVVERSPQTALQAIRLKLDVLKWLQSRADLEVVEDVTCQLIVPGLDMSTPVIMRKYGSAEPS